LIIQDILAAIPWGFLLAISIGPGFFVLLETSITKGFKAAFTLDCGIIFSDIIFILIAYFASNQILAQFKDNPNLYIIGGSIMAVYGVISYIQLKKKFDIDEDKDIDDIPNNKYFGFLDDGYYYSRTSASNGTIPCFHLFCSYFVFLFSNRCRKNYLSQTIKTPPYTCKYL
jgi:arginine exporter protein ArgO